MSDAESRSGGSSTGVIVVVIVIVVLLMGGCLLAVAGGAAMFLIRGVPAPEMQQIEIEQAIREERALLDERMQEIKPSVEGSTDLPTLDSPTSPDLPVDQTISPPAVESPAEPPPGN